MKTLVKTTFVPFKQILYQKLSCYSFFLGKNGLQVHRFATPLTVAYPLNAKALQTLNMSIFAK